MKELFDDYRKPAQTGCLILMGSREPRQAVAQVMGEPHTALATLHRLEGAGHLLLESKDLIKQRNWGGVFFSISDLLSYGPNFLASLFWERLYLIGHLRRNLATPGCCSAPKIPSNQTFPAGKPPPRPARAAWLSAGFQLPGSLIIPLL